MTAPLRFLPRISVSCFQRRLAANTSTLHISSWTNNLKVVDLEDSKSPPPPMRQWLRLPPNRTPFISVVVDPPSPVDTAFQINSQRGPTRRQQNIPVDAHGRLLSLSRHHSPSLLPIPVQHLYFQGRLSRHFFASYQHLK
ncbi:hypothetical protein A1Q2_01421 [Trichosporon asahii var. asahii CBS 8904]|uniref:Uncharacterized protein n=1 Tax=Trichosporon asahii var. asahii (strain CBS 8904) TaxID=1220162 RepID=K1W5T0_TRIAC|nr:hypothetical protein A1Q2_01421 [Trichosporon asahii var. asahii CBS 8904]